MEDGRWKAAHAGVRLSSILHPPFSNWEEHRMTPLSAYLILSAFLFAIGLAGALTRRNAIIVLIGIELMLNAANLNFIAFGLFSEPPETLTGIMFVKRQNAMKFRFAALSMS